MCPLQTLKESDEYGVVSPRLLEFLGRVEAYPEITDHVKCIETHISWVFLTDHFAYKLKKPVKYDFLDFSTSELRRNTCENEVLLNRRLAPHVYLGVVPITRNQHGRLKLGGQGTPIDWVVKMRRLPADRTLEELILSQSCCQVAIKQLASRFADFYEQLPPLNIRTEAYREHFEQHAEANHSELADSRHHFDPSLVKRVHAAQLRLLHLAPDILDNRVCDGRIVEGHGDLRPEHIYLTPEPLVIDCIEFNDEFRQLDVLDELGFLAMECDRLGAESVGQQIIDEYQQRSGDRPAKVLLPFYKCYRACVRAKVLALRDLQLSNHTTSAINPATAARKEARGYLELTDRYAAQLGPPLLLVVCGLPGSGKSTVANNLAKSLEIDVLSTDSLRRDLFGNGNGKRPSCGYNEGDYSPLNRAQVYQSVFRRAEKLLDEGLSVVLDGTFLSANLRSEAISLARRHGAEPLLIRCECAEDVARERILSRAKSGEAVSKTRPEFLPLQQKQNEPDPPDVPILCVDTTTSTPAIRQQIFTELRGRLFADSAE